MNHADDRRQVEEVKRALSDPQRLAEALGIAEGSKRQARGILVRCPKHAENNPSCSITTGDDGGIGVRCFAGCDFGGAKGGGDVLHLIAAVRGLDPSREFAEVLAEAAGMAGIDIGRAAPAPRPVLAAVPAAQPAPADLSAEWARLGQLDADGWDFLRDRELDDAASMCRAAPTSGPLAAVSPGIAVALRDSTGRVVGIQARNLIVGKGHDFRVHGASAAGLFGDPVGASAAQTVVICEGLTDTLAATIGFAVGKSMAVVGIAGVKAADALRGLEWKGKRALVAMDADEAGDAAAKSIGEMVDKAGGRAVRLRPEGHKDLAAMRAAGVDLLAFARSAAGRAMGFLTFGERVEGERARRMADAGKALSYGVPYLNALTGGIVPRDVVLLGAESGLGKTELATIIAMCASAAGRRVHYFALEPEPLEVERRIKFKLLVQLVGQARPGVHLGFQDWMFGKLDHLTRDFEAEADRILADRFRTLNTFYRHSRGGPFTAEDFGRMARGLEDESDLIVLDHVHYFDDDGDANRSQKRNAMSFRDLAIQTGRPQVQIAHLRKKSSQVRKAPRLVPERDDFEGSSHLFKPVKRAIILAPAFNEKRPVPWVWPTYLALVKNTFDSTRCRYVGLVGFNARKNAYEESFLLGQLKQNGEKFAVVEPEDLPYWANQSDNQPQQEIPRPFTAGDPEAQP